MEDESDRKIMIKLVTLRAETYIQLIDDSREDKKANVAKTCAIKRKIKFENYENCLEAT